MRKKSFKQLNSVPLSLRTCWDILSRHITVQEPKTLLSTEPEQLGPFRPIRPTLAISARFGPRGPLGWRASPPPILYKYGSFPPYYGWLPSSLFSSPSSFLLDLAQIPMNGSLYNVMVRRVLMRIERAWTLA
ncbi:unnamed protein product [Cuscuta epithymum]|uniref:Uncharacterized protein n=1 Tax=Cuscuta epithymum TaxID=186058 RepID=A0AAV0CK38_9ASTE|nr:unnamed protein product [Cuscuta epithymum]